MEDFDTYVERVRPILWKDIVNDHYNEVMAHIALANRFYPKCRPVVFWRDSRGQTPLHVACQCASVRTAQILLDAGADFYCKSNNAATPYVCVDHPVLREKLKQYAFDVSPEGKIYWEKDRIIKELARQKQETEDMMAADEFSWAVELMERERIAQNIFFHFLSRSKYIENIIEYGLWLATERIITHESMEICEKESRNAWNYDAYLTELERKRKQDEYEAMIQEREWKQQEAFRIAKEERMRQKQEADKQARFLRYCQDIEEEENRKRKAEAAAKAEADKIRFMELSKEMERVASLKNERLKYDVPRRVRLYARMRLGIHMRTCNTMNYNSGVEYLNPTASLEDIPPKKNERLLKSTFLNEKPINTIITKRLI